MEQDKVLGENLKNTRLACLVEAARTRLRESEMPIKPKTTKFGAIERRPRTKTEI